MKIYTYEGISGEAEIGEGGTMKTKETRHTRYITCPFCGHEDQDSWEVDFGPGAEGDTEVECGSCDEPFIVSRIVDVTYTSTVKAEEVKL